MSFTFKKQLPDLFYLVGHSAVICQLLIWDLKASKVQGHPWSISKLPNLLDVTKFVAYDNVMSINNEYFLLIFDELQGLKCDI